MTRDELEAVVKMMRAERVQSFSIEGDKVLVSFSPSAFAPAFAPSRVGLPVMTAEEFAQKLEMPPDIEDPNDDPDHPDSDLMYSAALPPEQPEPLKE